MENVSTLDTRTLCRIGTVLELGLVGLAMAISWWVEDVIFPFPLEADGSALLAVVLGTLPLAAFGLIALEGRTARLPAFRGIYERLRETLGPAVVGMSNGWIALLSLSAGIGEEALFRGVLQDLWGFGTTCLIFAVLHALTPTYFFLAFGISIYLGWIYRTTENLLVPIAIHAIYDAFALALLRRRFRADGVAALLEPPETTDDDRGGENAEDVPGDEPSDRSTKYIEHDSTLDVPRRRDTERRDTERREDDRQKSAPGAAPPSDPTPT
jgi:membrane protease YdiL (CAAX protease family)